MRIRVSRAALPGRADTEVFRLHLDDRTIELPRSDARVLAALLNDMLDGSREDSVRVPDPTEWRFRIIEERLAGLEAQLQRGTRVPWLGGRW
jgi:hypothetical protein